MMMGEREARMFNQRSAAQGDRVAFAAADKDYYITQMTLSLADLQAAEGDTVRRGMALQGLTAVLTQEAASRQAPPPAHDADIARLAKATLKRLKASKNSQKPPAPQ